MKSAVITILLLAQFSAPASTAPEDERALDPVLERGEERVEASRDAQQRVDAVNEQIRDKVAEYRTLEKQIDGLEVYIEQLRLQRANQDREIDELSASIENVTLIERQVIPLMLRMIDGLEQHVALDVPFLPEERAERVESLQGLVERSDVTVAEKFRTVFDAYQTEMEYGRTIEAYRGMLETGNGEREVDFLRVGRVGLYYVSLDGSLLGTWNREIRQWETLPGEYRTHVAEGLRIAREQAAPDLIKLPLPAPEDASS
ncbi:MAG: DUF3450 domain-containing protein [Proteobacteria bacterium]|nr:DUF3450 domain-containing protein [Pseudomonadota bacterium]